MNLNDAAKICHGTISSYKTIIGEPTLTWEELSEWKRASIAQGVQHVLDDPYIRPETIHAIWVAGQAVEGWTYGKAFDPEAKKHPGIVKWDCKDEAQRTKDRLFISTINALRGQIQIAPAERSGGGLAVGANFGGTYVTNMNIYQH